MKILYGWFVLVLLILVVFYYVNLNLEKTVKVDDFLKLEETSDFIRYSVKNADDKSKIYTLSINKDSEIIVLSDSNKTFNQKEKVINVNLNRDGKNIILILLSEQKVTWEINFSNNTNISLAIFNQINSDIKSKIKFYKKYENLEYLLDIKELDFLNLLKYIKSNFSQNEISYFYKQKGNESISINKNLDEKKIDIDFLTPKKVQSEIEFELLSKDLDFIKFDLKGPKDKSFSEINIKKNVTFNSNKSKIYETLDNGIKIIDVETRNEIIKPIPVGRKIFNYRGIAYDQTTNRVFIGTKNGKFYVFNAVLNQWQSIRKYIEDFDINSLSYDFFSNVYLSSTWKSEGLILFDQDGNFIKRIDLTNKLKCLSYYYDKTKDMVPELYIVGQGNDIAIVLIRDFVEQIWYYDKLNDEVTLTYNYYFL